MFPPSRSRPKHREAEVSSKSWFITRPAKSEETNQSRSGICISEGFGLGLTDEDRAASDAGRGACGKRWTRCGDRSPRSGPPLLWGRGFQGHAATPSGRVSGPSSLAQLPTDAAESGFLENLPGGVFLCSGSVIGGHVRLFKDLVRSNPRPLISAGARRNGFD